ncbi:3-oxoacyl-ACP synthase III family protein [Nocardiopsis sp. NRRL B-16309]|uniref:3-oxoacyl-ACP synthase III family protein n=1 Tax=Nocardiopsis sp. NRRL B-16309 TaxID=1519494 RepID=UPI0006AEB4C6|nr:beta-ketoacyl-ACP synthase III [Nocardiopsis sp. NRRL B-16309]KOX12621.1 3-oxoacyl-ACP synthase [Nocardiopsis sp. NRRL B-16309]
MTIAILSTGSYLPTDVVGNAPLAHAAGVTDEWIRRKTGIRERRRAAPDQATSDLAAEAGRRALAQAGVPADRLAYVIVATSTPDHPQPATASITQDLLGARSAAAFDVNAVCSGFVYALSVAEHLLRPHGDAYALVIGADIYSRILDYGDRRTAVLFGDGAGAVLLGPAHDRAGVIGTELLTDGDHHHLIRVPAGGSRLPASPETLERGEHFFQMEGRGVREYVTRRLPGTIHRMLDGLGVDRDDVRHFVPHQANGAMLTDIWPSLGLDHAHLHLTVETQGNTGAGSIPVALDTVHRSGLLQRDDLVLLAGFGGGMSVGLALVRWSPVAEVPSPVRHDTRVGAAPVHVPA